jgi:hypothetical protein
MLHSALSKRTSQKGRLMAAQAQVGRLEELNPDPLQLPALQNAGSPSGPAAPPTATQERVADALPGSLPDGGPTLLENGSTKILTPEGSTSSSTSGGSTSTPGPDGTSSTSTASAKGSTSAVSTDSADSATSSRDGGTSAVQKPRSGQALQPGATSQDAFLYCRAVPVT